jgi:hypothetical protein
MQAIVCGLIVAYGFMLLGIAIHYGGVHKPWGKTLLAVGFLPIWCVICLGIRLGRWLQESQPD